MAGKRIAMLGAGANGAFFRAALTNAEDVVLIEQWPQRAEPMLSRGVVLNAPEASVRAEVKADTRSLKVLVPERRFLEVMLDQAVAEVRAASAAEHQGVVVTRHSFKEFTVAVSPEVPYGITLEVDAW
jgi:hypothetical protein